MTTHSPARAESVPATYAGMTGPAVDYLQAHPDGRLIAMTQDRFGDVPYLLEALRPNVNADRRLRSSTATTAGHRCATTWLQLVTALTTGRVDPELTLRAQAVTLPLDPDALGAYGVRYALIDDSVVPVDQFVPGWRPSCAPTAHCSCSRTPSGPATRSCTRPRAEWLARRRAASCAR